MISADWWSDWVFWWASWDVWDLSKSFSLFLFLLLLFLLFIFRFLLILFDNRRLGSSGGDSASCRATLEIWDLSGVLARNYNSIARGAIFAPLVLAKWRDDWVLWQRSSRYEWLLGEELWWLVSSGGGSLSGWAALKWGLLSLGLVAWALDDIARGSVFT